MKKYITEKINKLKMFNNSDNLYTYMRVIQEFNISC